jgi:ATP-dependent Clp protease ATP-binding subunit ClpC
MPDEIPMRLVGKSDVLDMISRWTGISWSSDSNIRKLDRVEKTLSTRVIDQYPTVNAIGRAISRPLACFMFCGPTGVVKTKVVKALA